jgi:hypothetical protein
MFLEGVTGKKHGKIAYENHFCCSKLLLLNQHTCLLQSDKELLQSLACGFPIYKAVHTISMVNHPFEIDKPFNW